jgi:hypothetical protein
MDHEDRYRVDQNPPTGAPVAEAVAEDLFDQTRSFGWLGVPDIVGRNIGVLISFHISSTCDHTM